MKGSIVLKNNKSQRKRYLIARYAPSFSSYHVPMVDKVRYGGITYGATNTYSTSICECAIRVSMKTVQCTLPAYALLS